MTARKLDGIATASAVKESLCARVSALAASGALPGLGTLLVGEDPASRSYVLGKHRDCAEIGINSIAVELPATATQDEVLAAVAELNTRDDVSGFIVQLPMPKHIDENLVLEAIAPSKDADGLHPVNLGRLVLGETSSTGRFLPLPCTPNGIIELIRHHGLEIAGKHVVIIGRGVTVGRPLSLLLTLKGIDATITVVHSRTPDLAAEVRRADIVVAAVGVPHFVQAGWVKPGAVVLDVGVTRVGMTESGKAKLAGDVDPAVAEVAGWLSPNPGGVGPMTRALLVSNVVGLAEAQLAKKEG